MSDRRPSRRRTTSRRLPSRARTVREPQPDQHARRPSTRRVRPLSAARPRRLDASAYRASAQQHLRRFRQGSALAVALTALLLLVWGTPLELEGHPAAHAASSGNVQTTDTVADAAALDPGEAVDQATGTIRDLAYNFWAFLPRLVFALLLLGAAALIVKAAGALVKRALGSWERAAAVTAITRLVVFLVAIVASLSVLAGDIRALVGSVGLLGLAASWALQTPIESFTGWLLNSFRGYYRVGDRIAVGDVFGDVYRIDVLTTTVWEAGGPGKPVSAAQSTGALITFPNWEVLRSNVVNYSRDFPYVWDEITIGVANESDLGYSSDVIEATARRVLGEQMSKAAERYEQLLRAERLMFDVDEVPRVYLSPSESWTDCTLRYLVPVRTRRLWSSTLLLEISREIARPEHKGRIVPVYPRREVVVRDRWPAS